jgi:hypothetical protein
MIIGSWMLRCHARADKWKSPQIRKCHILHDHDYQQISFFESFLITTKKDYAFEIFIFIS